MKSGRQLQTLDDLMAQAEHYAGWAMREIGNVPPTMMGLSPRGPLFFVPSGLPDDRAKDNFADTARLICVAHDATVAVMILESWMKLAKPGETLDTTELPSEAIDRREIVLLTGETRSGFKQKILDCATGVRIRVKPTLNVIPAPQRAGFFVCECATLTLRGSRTDLRLQPRFCSDRPPQFVSRASGLRLRSPLFSFQIAKDYSRNQNV